MASEPRNNDFGNDSDDVRQARLYLMSENIDTHKTEVGVGGALLTWAQGAFDNWVELSTTASREAGDIDEAYQEYELKYRIAHEKYVVAKELLLAVLGDYQDNDEAAEQYGVMKDTPRSCDGIYRAIHQFKDQHDIFTTATDPRVIADALVTAMVAAGDEFYPLWKYAVTQKKEARQAYDVKQDAFAVDTKKLRLIFRMAVAVWGDNDPKLKELGFVPASEIWTPGQPVQGQANFPDKVENMKAVKAPEPSVGVLISSNTLNGAFGYKIRHAKAPTGSPRPEKPPTDWMTGEIPSFLDPDVQVGMVYYYWMCGVDADGVEGAWSDASLEWTGAVVGVPIP
jgi:hypothetical protein